MGTESTSQSSAVEKGSYSEKNISVSHRDYIDIGSRFSESAANLKDFSPVDIQNILKSDEKEVGKYLNSNSNWYFDKVFENPYISSTLYFNSSTKVDKLENDTQYIAIEKCIVKPFSFSIDNRFDQVGSTPFSKINTLLFRNLRELASLDKSAFAIGLKTQSGLISNFLEGIKSSQAQNGNEGGFFHSMASNALNLIEGFKTSLDVLNGVQFESDAGFARSFIASSISSPVHATFFFLQDTSKSIDTNRDRAANLLTRLLPYQQLYTSWLGEKGVLTKYNPKLSKIVEDVREGIVDASEKLGVKFVTDTVSDITDKVFNGGVITTHAPNDYITQNQNALKSAIKGIPDKRTFLLVTPWGYRYNLLPINIQVQESQSKVIINDNKVLPMLIQIDVDFVTSRRLISQDVYNHVSGKMDVRWATSSKKEPVKK